MPNIAQQAAANDGRNAQDAYGQRPVMPPPFSLPPFIPFGKEKLNFFFFILSSFLIDKLCYIANSFFPF